MTTRKMKPAHENLAILLSRGTPVRTAAEELGVGASTIYRWSLRPDVRGRVQELRGTATAAAIASLRDALGGAIATLTGLMADEEVPPSVRCSAAAKLLEQALRAIETGEILQRLEALERIRNGGSEGEE